MQIPIFLPNFDSVISWVGYILVMWVVFLVGLQNLGIFLLVASFNKPEIGICISFIVSKLVLLMEFHEVGCCMACVS